MKFPAKYNRQDYVAWHENHFPNDIDFERKIKIFRDQLMVEAKNDLEFISNFVQSVISMASHSYQVDHGSTLNAEFPLLNILMEKKLGINYELLFKSEESIINKLWRKNRVGDEVELQNIKVNISDLVRTEIITPTLESCKFLAKRLERQNIYFPDKKQEKEFKEKIYEITFEPEMKMASGYFAYHGIISCKSGLQIEVQIYSTLMKVWRKLSHKLYDKARIRTVPKLLDYGTSETRLISLGHLLHLAECELTRLDEEL
jgi:ppGpp synthetase/RelA/SpoT-type nucleotidyltranferase